MYRYIVAMSVDKQKIQNDLIDSGKQTVLHIIKLVLYPDSPSVNHWKQEIYSFLHDVPKLKGSNKIPEASFIFNAISSWDDMIDKLVIEVQDEEEVESSVEVNIDQLQTMISEYHRWAADELSSSGILRRSDVYSKIDEIMNKGGNT